MDCTSALERLSERLDATLDPPVEAELDEHLSLCSTCQAAVGELAQVDRLCRRELPRSNAASRIATTALLELSSEPPRIQSETTRPRWGILLAAAGTIVAVAAVIMVSAPRQDDVADGRNSSPSPTIAQPANGFDVTLAKGTIEVRRPDNSFWEPLSLPRDAEQPVGCELRTAADGLCEFTCPEGGVVRLDRGSEVHLTDGNELRVRRGRMWCQAPERAPLHVIAEIDDPLAPVLTATMTCPATACAQAAVEQSTAITVFASQGAVDVAAGDSDVRVAPGSRLTMTSVSHEVERAADPLEETCWMTPLLALRGGEDREFRRQVDRMLARVGATKVSYLYEQQMRDLGAPCALALIAYLRSPSAAEDVEKRVIAARIIRDTASESMIPDLVELLADREAEVRVAAAEALARLTGQTQDMAPEDWRAPGPARSQALERWRQWLKSPPSKKV